MADPKNRVQYPQLKGSEQHHDLKNDPGKLGDPDHMKEDTAEDTNSEDDKG